MAIAVVCFIALTLALPERLTVVPRWVLPAGMALLVALVATDPGQIESGLAGKMGAALPPRSAGIRRDLRPQESRRGHRDEVIDPRSTG
jgi:hypothetical protein